MTPDEYAAECAAVERDGWDEWFNEVCRHVITWTPSESMRAAFHAGHALERPSRLPDGD